MDLGVGLGWIACQQQMDGADTATKFPGGDIGTS